MANISSAVTGRVAALLKGDAGVNDFPPERLFIQNVSPDLADRTTGSKYPCVFLYCDKVSNSLRQKFLTFSGFARVTVEIRCSADRPDRLQLELQNRADAVCELLTAARGDWGAGMFHAGAYELTFGPVKSGGTHFLQMAKVVFEVEVNR